MTRIIAVALQKGGVGKTTTAQHLAHGLAFFGRRILLVDLDSQGSASNRYDQALIRGTLTDVMGGRGEPTKKLKEIISQTYVENLLLVAGDGELEFTENRLASVQDWQFKLSLLFAKLPFDYIILDTPPGKSRLQKAALVAADEIIIPVQLSPMGFEGFVGVNRAIDVARASQQIAGGVRLRIRAVVPTFYRQGERVSDSFLAALKSTEHPDYSGDPLPLAPLPVIETTAFEQVSAAVSVGNGYRARTIFEVSGPAGSPTARGQEAYMRLAEFVDGF